MKVVAAIFLSIISFFSGSNDLRVRGIILPHHDLAKPIFHESLSKFKKEDIPSTIVLYGTNHYFPVGPTFTTTKEVKDRHKLDEVFVDDDMISKEHSIQTPSPYLKEYFPDVEIIPIIIGTEYDFYKIDTLSKYLIGVLPKDTLYIASVDFSHNSTVLGGLSKNNESVDAIANFNYQKILSYQDDHMDSPVAIVTFMKTMENLNAKTWETWISSHGGLITNNPLLNGTSYVVGAFR